MKRSEPECKNYISEDMCAGSAHRPEAHCHDGETGDCPNFKPKTVRPATEKKAGSGQDRTTSLDMID